MSDKVNLFIVGAPKAGTSALHNYLNKHPDIFMSEFKEPHFFSTDLHAESDKYHGKKKYFPIRTMDQYRNIFKGKEAYKVNGEASASYLFSKDAAKNIHNYNPDAKIIIMLREPIEFMRAWHGQLLFDMGESIKDFEEALKSENKRKKGKKLNNTVMAPSFLYYSDWAKYLEQIKRFQKNFKEDSIKIIIFEEFKKNNKKVLKEVYEFLKVDSSIEINVSKTNQYKTLRGGKLQRAVKATNIGYYLRKLLGDNIFNKLTSVYFFVIARKSKKSELDPDLIIKLKNNLKDEVIELEKQINIRLTKMWGYEASNTKDQ